MAMTSCRLGLKTLSFCHSHRIAIHRAAKSRLERASTRRMGESLVPAAMKCWVKGDPVQNVLGDCPFCHRALLTLEEKGVAYEKVYVNFNDKPEELFKDNPKGSVPVLENGDTWIPDSGRIVEYLNEAYPKPPMPLDPEASELVSPFFGAFKALRNNVGDKDLEAALTTVLQNLEDLLVKRGTDFFGGDGLNAADAEFLPRFYHMSTVLGSEGWALPESVPKLKAYFDRATSRPSWINTDYGPELILKGWGVHKD